ncbi:MAG: SoxR reducing system RseC family protein [Deltaproteobacteria bacterium]|nr:SoxR reducing system RseC family protein [Deltaproteobacteria bacterium]MBW2017688.1 SoxR reducing system RseC family protein [Deltaproteobacteria bacterium]MBW2130721.1 SoxR reducing system RseC family protein [Deltaproteobacteria bacterium]MBW2303401.1 SoxR reducing system RseC family protein [Deltaproteobacteria bacterium]
MPKYEGLVSALKERGMAEVIIRPGESGIPGAPEVSRRVCHCATDSATLVIEALNKAGARPGDWVALYRDPGILLKNAAALIGLPCLGALFGVVMAVLFSFGTNFGFLAAITGLLLGLVPGIMIFRKNAAKNRPFIQRVIRPGDGMPPPCNQQSSEPASFLCDGCALNR